MLKSKKQRPCPCGSGRKFGKCCGTPAMTHAVAMMKALAAKRSCGECQACCEIVGVKSLGKPYQRRCEYQCPTGCAIYNARPTECVDYECLWKMHHEMPDDTRPDKSGILLQWDKGIGGTMTLHVYETRPGAVFEMPHELAAWIDERSKQKDVLIVPHGSQEGTEYHTHAKYGDDTFGKKLGAAQLEYSDSFYVAEPVRDTSPNKTFSTAVDPASRPL